MFNYVLRRKQLIKLLGVIFLTIFIMHAAGVNYFVLVAEDLNNVKENTGARRLRTIVEAVLDDIMF